MSGSVEGLSNGGLDPSIPLQAGRGVPQPNPLGMIGQYANTANALNTLKLFPGQQQLQQQQIQSGATSLAQQNYRAAWGVAVPLLAKKNITLNDFTNAMASAEQHYGIVTQGAVQDVLDNGGTPDTPEFSDYLRSKIASMSQGNNENAVAQVTPRVGEPVMGPGGVVQPTTVAPAGLPNPGVTTVAPGAGIQAGLSPADATTPTQIGVTPSGAPIYGTRQQFIGQTGGMPGAQTSPLGTGRALPPALRNPNAPGATPAATQGVVTGLGPAQTAALTTGGTQSAGAFQNISEQGVQAKSQAAILDNMLGDTTQFTTGPGAEGIKDFKAVVQRFAPTVAGAFGIQPDSLAANESFDKLANQLANAQGAGSDARLAVNQGANPSSSRTPAGVDLIIRQLRGNSDYLQARSQLAAAYPDQSDRPGFEASVASNLDPRVFQYNRLTAPQKTTFFNAMADKDAATAKAFIKSYDWAQSNQLLAPP
jgi:hypothetical protein